MNKDLKDIYVYLIIIVYYVLYVLISFSLIAFLLMILWNILMHDVVGLSAIKFKQCIIITSIVSCFMFAFRRARDHRNKMF